MVKRLLLVFLTLFFLADGLEIASEIDRSRPIYEGDPIHGILTVTHKNSVSLKSIKASLEGKALTLDEVKTLPIGGEGLSMTVFHFTLPPKKAGYYFLPPITLVVGKETGTSYPVSFTVMELSSRLSEKETSEYLQVTPLYEGNNPLYPGEKSKLGYRYLYRGDMRLTEEILPMLAAKELTKIGNPTSKDGREKEFSTLEVWQEIEAETPGDFSFPPAILSGVLMSQDGGPKRFHLETLPFTLRVLPFPEEGKPHFFSGASGSFTASAVLFEDELTGTGRIGLAYTIEGKGSLSKAYLPQLCCQPGWSGNFETEKLSPPLALSGKKTWKIYLKNIGSSNYLPSIYFAFFNPEKKEYQTLITSPLKIPLSKKVKEKIPSSEKVAAHESSMKFMAPSYFRSVVSRAGTLFFLLPLAFLTFRFRPILGSLLAAFALFVIFYQAPSIFPKLVDLQQFSDSSPEVRQKEINQALQILFEEYPRMLATPETPFWIAESLRYLGEESYARLYEERGLRNFPRIKSIFSVSSLELRALLGISLALTLLFWNQKFLQRFGLATSLVLLLILLSRNYLEPPKALLVEASFIYPNKNSLIPILDIPVESGTLVELLEDDEGKWLKIGMKDGMVGFIDKNKVRLI